MKLPQARRPLDAQVTIPGSKSLTNRALVAAVMASGRSILTNALFAEDTERMVESLQRLGFSVSGHPDSQRMEVQGNGGHVPESDVQLDCGNSGTTIRFCTALAALGRGKFEFDGNARMRERPIGQLVSALQALGTRAEYQEESGSPPVTLYSNGLTGGKVRFDSPESSQFVSALLLAAPGASDDVMIEVEGPLVSAPYVRMTARVMEAFGVSVISEIRPKSSKFIVAAPQSYRSCEFAVEPDASNASYFLAAPAVAGGRVTVKGLGADSIQGDIRMVDLLEQMGCKVDVRANQLTVESPPSGGLLKPLIADLSDTPDLVPTIAVLALFADGSTAIRNVANLRLKETDRLAALSCQLAKLGAAVEEYEDGLTIHSPHELRPAVIDTYDDHRMAMAFALAGLGADGVVIMDPLCVGKTFPGFFDVWAGMLK